MSQHPRHSLHGSAAHPNVTGTRDVLRHRSVEKQERGNAQILVNEM